MYLTQYIGSGTLLIAAVIALIAAFATIGSLTAQLKQATHQSAAGNYIRRGSFDLSIQYDRFLYENTTRRKIETNQQKK